MLKVASLVLDCYDDTDGAIARTLPPEILACSIESPDKLAALSDKQFGLVMKTAGGVIRKFPLHTEDARKVSFAYWTKTAARLPAEVRKVAEARMNDQVPVGYVDLTKVAADTKIAFASEAWGLTVGGKNYFPLHDADLVKVAAQRFGQSTDSLAPQHKFAYARAIHKRAADLKVVLPADSETRWYSHDEINVQALKHAIAMRKRAAAGRCSTEVLDQLADAIGVVRDGTELESADARDYRAHKAASFKLAAEKPEVVVATLQAFDKLAGFDTRHYRQGVPDPFASCFREPMKAAQHIVDGVDLDTIDVTQLSAMFEPDFIQDFKTDPVGTYKALPDPMKAAIRSLAEAGMGASGVGKGKDPAPVIGAGGAEPTNLLDPSYANESVGVSR